MRSIRIGEYIGEGKYEVCVDGNRYTCHETDLNFFIKHHIFKDIYHNYDYSGIGKYRIADFLTTLVILGVDT